MFPGQLLPGLWPAGGHVGGLQIGSIHHLTDQSATLQTLSDNEHYKLSLTMNGNKDCLHSSPVKPIVMKKADGLVKISLDRL